MNLHEVKKKYLLSSVAVLSLIGNTHLCAENLASTDLKENDISKLGSIEIKGTNSTGTADEGYKTDKIENVGPFKNMLLKDAPYSIQIISSDLIENTMASSPDKVLSMNPVVKMNVPDNTPFNPGLTIRGFSVRASSGTAAAIDGIRTYAYRRIATTNIKNIEVTSGVSSFLYGATNPGGFINYNLKDPTKERINNVTVGNYGGSNYFLHGDFGGKLNESGTLTYRVNAMVRDGDTAVEDNSMREMDLSAALAWKVTNNLNLELDLTHNDSSVKGTSPYWIIGGANGMPSAPDTSKNWSQDWISDENILNRIAGKATWDINDYFTLRAAYAYRKTETGQDDGWMYIYITDNNDGTYNNNFAGYGPYDNEEHSYQVFLDSSFNTGSVEHMLTVGYSSLSNEESWTDNALFSTFPGTFTLSNPVHVPKPDYTFGNSYKSSETSYTTITLGDHIYLNSEWEMLVGMTSAGIDVTSYQATGAVRQAYDKTALTPSASIIYKPNPWLSTYISYMEGLEVGGVAPTTAANVGELLDPLVSTQYELGLKLKLNESLVTLAFFNIEKPYEFTNSNNVYAQDGRQVHRGIELTSTGKITENLTFLGGGTWLDAQIEKSDNSALEGKTPIDVATLLVKAYAEYKIPSFSNISINGGLYYTGEQYIDELNENTIPAYTTLDMGVRYHVDNYILRLNVNNVTGEDYWVSKNYIGQPRSISFSLEMKL